MIYLLISCCLEMPGGAVIEDTSDIEPSPMASACWYNVMVEAVEDGALAAAMVVGGSGDEGSVICRQGMWGCLLGMGEF